ncbi:nucleolar protein 10-like [Acanthaster planci]|uniref:Nucleolar protein 10 n=1 Tax=Acanthaster planci TaxID=133434 RepID=A0A8B7ZB89_ACAPL|nr:nucleolar protein 10-like [Acanthaster planci]
MQVSQANNVKVYNLSLGKSLPEWLSDRKKRALQKSDRDLQHRIQLIQDFEMPSVSSGVQITADNQFILATGTYKPRVRCFEVTQLSMKFERCFDSEVVRFHILSEDYSKMVFLHCDRYVEFHARYGRYHRLRIPKFGRDLAYHEPSCDLFLVGASPEVYRLNLEQGRFLSPFLSEASAINACSINPEHHLLALGTLEGRVECWDPRSRKQAAILDCALSSVTTETQVKGMPSVSALKFKDGLQMAVGTSTGQVLLYDIRSDKPLLVKDHHYSLPIKAVEFHPQSEMVVSTDSRAVRIWDVHTGKAFTAIEPEHSINGMCLVPSSGLILTANEAPKLGVYFIPSLGPAPKWCAFLDNLTEELEDSSHSTIYDDYKFVTKAELENLGLAHLVGTSLLRAYMHGYFMDIRLYHKAKAIADPFAYEEYVKSKIKQKIEEDRASRVKLRKLPKVNAALASKLQEQQELEQTSKGKRDKKAEADSILHDDRFAALFKNPEFQVDESSEDYRLLHPVITKQQRQQQKAAQKRTVLQQFDELEEEEGRPSDEDSSSDDDDRSWQQELRKQHQQLREERRAEARSQAAAGATPKFYELKKGEEFSSTIGRKRLSKRQLRTSLADRLAQEDTQGAVKHIGSSVGNQQLTFTVQKTAKEAKFKQDTMEHHRERKKLRRSAGQLAGKSRAGKFHR